MGKRTVQVIGWTLRAMWVVTVLSAALVVLVSAQVVSAVGTYRRKRRTLATRARVDACNRRLDALLSADWRDALEQRHGRAETVTLEREPMAEPSPRPMLALLANNPSN